MKRVDFPNWRDVLAHSSLSERDRRSYEIVVKWFLEMERQQSAAGAERAGHFVSRGLRENAGGFLG
jgi:hypothetical protein